MSLERIFKALMDLGLSETDSRVYIKITLKGPMYAKTIIEDLNISKQQFYPILKKLQNKKLIKITATRASVISALPFEDALEMLINFKMEKSKKILENKKELLSYWKAVNWNNGT